MAGKGDETQPAQFYLLCKKIEKLKQLSSKRLKIEYMRAKILKPLSRPSARNLLYPVMRLLLAKLDTKRGYNLKEQKLGEVLCGCFALPENSARLVLNYKRPSWGDFHPQRVSFDFADLVVSVVSDRCRSVDAATLTVREIDEFLEKVSDCSAQLRTVKEVAQQTILKTTALELKWVVRLLLKDMKTGLSANDHLKALHPNALEWFNNSCDLEKICSAVFSENKAELMLSLGKPIRPMLASRHSLEKILELAKKQKYLVEPKYDGERVQLHSKADSAGDFDFWLFTRQGLDCKETYSAFFSPLLKRCLACESCILDGEILVWDTDEARFEPFGFNKPTASQYSQSSAGPELHSKSLCYVAFDILMLNGHFLLEKQLLERRVLLKSAINPKENVFYPIETVKFVGTEPIVETLEKCIEKSYEGILLKNVTSQYKPNNRSSLWIKMKPDYIDAMATELDLCIVGCWKRGNRVKKLLTGLRDKNSDKWHTFAKIKPVFDKIQIESLFLRLEPFWVKAQQDSSRRSDFVSGYSALASKYKPTDSIKIEKSAVLEIIANGIVLTSVDHYTCGHTLRFPRIRKIRYDKAPCEALTLREMLEISQRGINSAARKEISLGGDKGALEKECAPVFGGKKICVIGDCAEYSKSGAERILRAHGAVVHSNPLSQTNFLVGDKSNAQSVRYKSLFRKNSWDIMDIAFVLKCIDEKSVLPAEKED